MTVIGTVGDPIIRANGQVIRSVQQGVSFYIALSITMSRYSVVALQLAGNVLKSLTVKNADIPDGRPINDPVFLKLAHRTGKCFTG